MEIEEAQARVRGAWPAQGYAFPTRGFLVRPHGYAAVTRTHPIPKSVSGAAGSPKAISTQAAIQLLRGQQVLLGERNMEGWPMWYIHLAGKPSVAQAAKIVSAIRHLSAAGMASNDPTKGAEKLNRGLSVIVKWPANGFFANFNKTVGNIWNADRREYISLGSDPKARTSSRRGPGRF